MIKGLRIIIFICGIFIFTVTKKVKILIYLHGYAIILELPVKGDQKASKTK